MRRAIVLTAITGLLFATSASALDYWYYHPQFTTGDYGDIGIIDPANPGTINAVILWGDGPDPVLEFDFAIHLSDIYYNAKQLTFSFMYDNSAFEVLGAHPLGSWTTHNYEDYEWPDSTAGHRVTIDGLTHGFVTASDYEEYLVSDVVPFMHVTMQIKDFVLSAGFGVTAMTLVSQDYSFSLWPEDFTYFGGHMIPEPATSSLLIAGVAALAGGIVRRRR